VDPLVSTATHYGIAVRRGNGPPYATQEVDPDMLRLGMVGTATVISDRAGPIGLLAMVLLWVKAYAAYL
jgi:hypothetical protein